MPQHDELGKLNLYKPKLTPLEGFDVELQDAIINYLNFKVDKIKNGRVYELRLCSLELARNPEGIFSLNLVRPVNPVFSLSPDLVMPDAYDALIANEINLQEALKLNVATSLRLSGQLDYFKAVGLPNEDCSIVIDLHFYYQRPPGAIGFHRDTVGNTLFVNLSYNNKEPIYAPEFIFDWDNHGKHLELVQSKLPPVFFDEIVSVMQNVGINKFLAQKEAEIVHYPGLPPGMLPPNIMVSWIDELYDHTTPNLGRRNRTVTTGQIRKWNNKEREWDEGQNASKYDAIEIFCIAAELKSITATTVNRDQLRQVGLGDEHINYVMGDASEAEWKTVRKKLLEGYKTNPLAFSTIFKFPEVRFSKDDLTANKNFSKLPHELQQSIYTHFWPDMSMVNIANPTELSFPEKLSGKSYPIHPFNPQPLKRQMSNELISRNMDAFEPTGGKRQFLRSWVMSYRKFKF